MSEGVIAVVCYRPKPGQEEALQQLLQNHVPTLRQQGLITDYPATLMTSQEKTSTAALNFTARFLIGRSNSGEKNLFGLSIRVRKVGLESTMDTTPFRFTISGITVALSKVTEVIS